MLKGRLGNINNFLPDFYKFNDKMEVACAGLKIYSDKIIALHKTTETFR